MDDIFKIRVLTAAINALMTPAMKVYNALFRGKEHMEPSDRLAFEVISGSESILKNVSVYAPAEVTGKTGRKVVTMEAPRLSQKRFIHVAELNALRAYGKQFGLEQMKVRIAREQLDMKGIMHRTLEFWAINALKGQILDADLSTVLVDYNMSATHKPVLAGTSLWTDAASDIVNQLRDFKKLIEDDAGTTITGWKAYVGSKVMDAMLANAKVRELLKYGMGVQVAETGKITKLAEVEFEEYNGSFVDYNGVRRRFLGEEYMILVGVCSDVVDVPYAPIMDAKAAGGVGNIDAGGNGALFFSKAWDEEDPSGRWIKAETRPLPVLQRPGAVVYAKVV